MKIQTMKYETCAGESLIDACAAALQLSKKNNCLVEFNFNTVSMEVAPSTDLEALAESYHMTVRQRHHVYEASDEYLEKKRLRELKVFEMQTDVNRLVDDLRSNVKSIDAIELLKLFKQWIPLQDESGVDGRNREVVSLLESIGYTESCSVGYSKDNYKKIPVLASYIAGQIISMNRRCGYVHPALGGMIEIQE